MLRIFASAGLESATVYQFVTPDAPHRRAPRRDLDMGSYAIVKPVWATRDRPTAALALGAQGGVPRGRARVPAGGTTRASAPLR